LAGNSSNRTTRRNGFPVPGPFPPFPVFPLSGFQVFPVARSCAIGGVCSIAGLILSRRRQFLPALDDDVQGDKDHGLDVEKNDSHNLQRIPLVVPNEKRTPQHQSKEHGFDLNEVEFLFSSALAAFVSGAQAG